MTHPLEQPDDHAQDRAAERAEGAGAHAEVVCACCVSEGGRGRQEGYLPTKYVPVKDSEKTVCQIRGTRSRNYMVAESMSKETCPRKR